MGLQTEKHDAGTQSHDSLGWVVGLALVQRLEEPLIEEVAMENRV